MIKINLLPTKNKSKSKSKGKVETKTKANIKTKKTSAVSITGLQRQMALGILILAGTFFGMWFYWNMLNMKINSLTKEKIAAQAKIREQEIMLKEVQAVEEERKAVLEKIAVIEQLKRNQTFMVHLLDEVSKALPQGVNLTSMTEKNGQINLEGTAFTNHDIVRFIDNLKTSPHCSDIFLQESLQGVQDEVEIYKYKLQFMFKGI